MAFCTNFAESCACHSKDSLFKAKGLDNPDPLQAGMMPLQEPNARSGQKSKSSHIQVSEMLDLPAPRNGADARQCAVSLCMNSVSSHVLPCSDVSLLRSTAFVEGKSFPPTLMGRLMGASPTEWNLEQKKQQHEATWRTKATGAGPCSSLHFIRDVAERECDC